MAIQDKKISDEMIQTKGVVAAPDRLTGSAEENKKVFDRLIREAVAPTFNGLVDELDGQLDPANQDGRLWAAVSAALLAAQSAGDFDGVGIERVEQTTVSTEDQGENVFAVHLTDGRSYSVSVRNGSKGSKGEKGDTGAQGEKGEKGDKGDTGPQGAQGPKGDTGAQGEKGPKGDTGNAGPQGETGPKGEPGVHYGSDEPGEEDTVWIDPSGAAAEFIPSPATAAVGQTIVVKAVDEDGKPTEWEAAEIPAVDATLTRSGQAADAKATGDAIRSLSEEIANIPNGGGGGVQSDWNQNDDTQPDYVKNRPFYAGDPVETVLVEERTISFEEWDGLYWAVFPSTFEATVGETYKVYWDGTAYECICVDADGLLSLGNFSILGVGSDTGEPFIVSVINGQGIEIATADTSASHTFSISETVVPVVKIDEGYLPSTIPFMEDGKIPEKYVQERFPNASDIFGGELVTSPRQESTLGNVYPNRKTLSGLTVEAFNVMLNDKDSRPRYVMVQNSVAEVTVLPSEPSTLYVSWGEFAIDGQSGNVLVGASVRALTAKIHEDTDNPGTMVSECAVITVVTKRLT